MNAIVTDATDPGATVVITHHIRDDGHAAYEDWLQQIAPLCRAAPGHLDWHIVRPIHGLTDTYTVIIRFDTEANLRAWMESPTRRALLERIRPLLAADDVYHVSSGLDFWFTPPGTKTPVPVRWKQYLVTWSAIFPLVLLLPLALVPALHAIGLPAIRWLDTLVLTGVVVFLMVYVVMPRYTALIRGWLFR